MSSKRDEDISRRFQEAEKLWKKHHYVEKPKMRARLFRLDDF